jgi:hypothetical protein
MVRRTLLAFIGLLTGFAMSACPQTPPTPPALPPQLTVGDASLGGEAFVHSATDLTRLTDAQKLVSFGSLLYYDNDTFGGNPAALLGKVAILTSPAGTTCTRDNMSSTPTWFWDRIVGPTTDPTKPTPRETILIDKQISAQINVLSYLGAGMNGDWVYSVSVTDNVLRVRDTDVAYSAAKQRFFQDHTADLISPKNVCYVGVIEGVTEKALTVTQYEKMEAGVKGGAFGVQVGASAYQSDGQSRSDFRFGLDPWS